MVNRSGGDHVRLLEACISYVLLVGSVWGFTISSVLAISNRNQSANRVLALFLFLVAWGLLAEYFDALGIDRRYPHLLWLAAPHSFVLGPLLHRYTRVLTRNEPMFDRHFAVHLVPFVVALTYFALSFYRLPAAVKLELVNGIERFGPSLTILVIRMLGRTSGLVYSGLALREAVRYLHRTRSYYSDTHKASLHWLIVILGLVTVAWTLSAISFSLEVGVGIQAAPLTFLTNVVALVLLYLMSYLAIQQPDLYNWVDHINREQLEYDQGRLAATGAPRGRPVNLDDSALERYRAQLLEGMERTQPYLDSMLTIKRLSGVVKIPVRVISYIVNENAGSNFYHFVNRYRIDHAAALLRDPAQRGVAILEIAYSSGFNSKSVFNTMFRKFRGMTPREFRSRSDS